MELIIEMHPDGDLFIKMDSLIRWFETQENDEMGDHNKYAALTLRAMRERALKNPSCVMNEETYLARKGTDGKAR